MQSSIANAPAHGDDLRERLAALAHEQWSGWMRWMFAHSTQRRDGAVVVPARLVERWQRQMRTPYDALPEDEKESDRKEADRVLALLGSGEAGSGED